MKVLIAHNAYGKYSGEEAVVDRIAAVLAAHGDEVCRYERTTAGVRESLRGKVRSFFAGIYSPDGVRGMREALEREQPDVVNVHNVFPFISPAALAECKKAGVPVIMTVHNFRLICPTGLFMRGGLPCEECLERHSEWGCLQHNCEGNWLKSLAYTLRSVYARRTRAFLDNVDIFSCITDFQRQKLIAAGIPEGKIAVNPNFLDATTEPEYKVGYYVAYCGRLSFEKGFDLLLEVARKHPEIPFKFAGALREDSIDEMPGNIALMGHISGQEYEDFVRNARFIVMPSRCYEGFPMAILEAAAQGKPTIGPDHGGFSEIIGKGGNAIGRLFKPNDINDLEQQVVRLWNAPEDITRLGRAAYRKLTTEYSSANFYDRFCSNVRKLTHKSPNGTLQHRQG